MALFCLQEEKERRLEEMFETAFDESNESRHAPKEELPEEGVVGLAGKKTQETLTATDLIIDALDMAEAEMKRLDQHKVSNIYFLFVFPLLFMYIYLQLLICMFQSTWAFFMFVYKDQFCPYN